MIFIITFSHSENMSKIFFVKSHCEKTLHAIWSYKERWDFSTTEALCTGSLNFPKKNFEKKIC